MPSVFKCHKAARFRFEILVYKRDCWIDNRGYLCKFRLPAEKAAEDFIIISYRRFFIFSNFFIKDFILSTELFIIRNPHILFAYGIYHKKIANIKKQETYRKTESSPQKNIVHANRQ